MVHEAEGNHVVPGMAVENRLLIRIPAFELVYGLNVFIFHNRLIPFHNRAIGDFRAAVVKLGGTYGTCIALGF